MTSTTLTEPSRSSATPTRADRTLLVLFLLSGFAALIYQVVWQRSLFAIFGIHVEAVTVVVTAFMVGLGLGSLAGGAISRRPSRSAVLWFAGIETAIGIFGLFSLRIMDAVGQATLLWSPTAIASVTFLLVLVPTLLMGSTLPLLVSHVVRRSRDVGGSVGTLYCVNTLGSAAACFASVTILLPLLGQQQSVMVAAAANILVGLGGLWIFRRDEQP